MISYNAFLLSNEGSFVYAEVTQKFTNVKDLALKSNRIAIRKLDIEKLEEYARDNNWEQVIRRINEGDPLIFDELPEDFTDYWQFRFHLGEDFELLKRVLFMCNDEKTDIKEIASVYREIYSLKKIDRSILEGLKLREVHDRIAEIQFKQRMELEEYRRKHREIMNQIDIAKSRNREYLKKHDIRYLDTYTYDDLVVNIRGPFLKQATGTKKSRRNFDFIEVEVNLTQLIRHEEKLNAVKRYKKRIDADVMKKVEGVLSYHEIPIGFVKIDKITLLKSGDLIYLMSLKQLSEDLTGVQAKETLSEG